MQIRNLNNAFEVKLHVRSTLNLKRTQHIPPKNAVACVSEHLSVYKVISVPTLVPNIEHRVHITQLRFDRVLGLGQNSVLFRQLGLGLGSGRSAQGLPSPVPSRLQENFL